MLLEKPDFVLGLVIANFVQNFQGNLGDISFRVAGACLLVLKGLLLGTLCCLLCTAADDVLDKLSNFIITNRALRHNFSTHSLHYNMYSKWRRNKDLT
jgi:hypothetical protein